MLKAWRSFGSSSPGLLFIIKNGRLDLNTSGDRVSRSHGFKLIVALILPQAAGAIGGFFSATNVLTWYATFFKPFFTPSGWIFGLVWGMLADA